jgi:hypothetical protein
MDSAQQLLTLARNLVAAADARDWRQLAQQDLELAALARRLSAQPVLSEAERDAVARARAAHLIASSRCAAESDRLAGLLEGLQSNREGWVAYALTEQWNEAVS